LEIPLTRHAKIQEEEEEEGHLGTGGDGGKRLGARNLNGQEDLVFGVSRRLQGHL